MSDFIRVGGVQKLQDGEFIVQVCVCPLFIYKYELSLLGFPQMPYATDAILQTRAQHGCFFIIMIIRTWEHHCSFFLFPGGAS